MSQATSRNAAFLEEMGVGAHWTLRRAAMTQLESPLAVAQTAMPEESGADVALVTPAPAIVSDDAFAAALADAVTTPRELVQESAGAVGASRVVAREPLAPAEAPQEMVAADVDVPAPARSAAMPAAAGASAPLPAPAPVRHASANTPPSSSDASAASDPADDSMAWFDDAPAPARPAPVSDEAIAMMDWPALKTAIATCTRCDLCATRRGVVPGRGAIDAQWMAIGAGPGRLDEKENRAITGDAGQLLENMLKAIALTSERDVYITNLVKCRPSSADGADRAPTPDEAAACRPYLERELALTGAAMLVTLGQAAAKGLLGAAARGKVLRRGELPVVATYHPDDLLRRPEDKAKAWGDLCLARAARDGAA